MVAVSESEENSRSGGPESAVSSGVGQPWTRRISSPRTGDFAENKPANGDRARLAVGLLTVHREIWTPKKCSYRGTCCGLPSAAVVSGSVDVRRWWRSCVELRRRRWATKKWEGLIDLGRPSTTPSRSSSSRDWRLSRYARMRPAPTVRWRKASARSSADGFVTADGDFFGGLQRLGGEIVWGKPALKIKTKPGAWATTPSVLHCCVGVRVRTCFTTDEGVVH